MIKAKKRWEKAFEKKMTEEEAVMFNWGYAYATDEFYPSLKEGCSKHEMKLSCWNGCGKVCPNIEHCEGCLESAHKEGCAND